MYDEDGEQIGYDKDKTFSYEQEIDSQTWQISGNTREEINAYLREHGFEVEENHGAHSSAHQVVSNKDMMSLIQVVVDHRVQKKEKPKMQPRPVTQERQEQQEQQEREVMEFDLNDPTFKKTKEQTREEALDGHVNHSTRKYKDEDDENEDRSYRDEDEPGSDDRRYQDETEDL